jgi:hypothetical protein
MPLSQQLYDTSYPTVRITLTGPKSDAWVLPHDFIREVNLLKALPRLIWTS